MSTTHEAYVRHMGARLEAARTRIAAEWLAGLSDLLAIEPDAIFPEEDLLDHIPMLIGQMARYVADPGVEDIATRTAVTEKARELGQLRHQQRASIHQVLREYDLLAEQLHAFVRAEATSLTVPPPLEAVFEVQQRIGRAIRVIMQMTVQTFVAEYTATNLQQAERLDRFHRAVGHELRGPLGALQFSAALLESATSDDQRQRFIETIKRNAQRAVTLIRELERLPATGVRNADTPLLQMIDLSELIAEVCRQVQDMAEARGVELEQDAAAVVVTVDPSRLELALVNLVSNAIKYSDPSKPRRFVRVEVSVGPTHLYFRVRDNGIGVPEQARATLFERFTRAHAHLDKELGNEGSGIGLSIVDECVHAMGGELSFESDEGQGTTFTIAVRRPLSLRPEAV
jgi:signal transduction histidine kinase